VTGAARAMGICGKKTGIRLFQLIKWQSYISMFEKLHQNSFTLCHLIYQTFKFKLVKRIARPQSMLHWLTQFFSIGWLISWSRNYILKTTWKKPPNHLATVQNRIEFLIHFIKLQMSMDALMSQYLFANYYLHSLHLAQFPSE